MGELLKIESAEAIALAHRFAELTGQWVEAAVSKSLKESVAREERIQAKVAEVNRITAEMRDLMDKPLPSSDHSFLYDENGLPA
jgi:hypothetical protein